jgi:hypothetical protein
LEFTKKGVTYIVSIKPGPNLGNASQIRRMVDDFRKAKPILQTNIGRLNVVAVNGCCYGRLTNEDRGDYLIVAGQAFWEFLSGDPDLYRRIIVPIGHKAKERNEEFAAEYAKVLNRFTEQFIADFCNPDGSIDWDTLLTFNSGKRVKA